MKEGILVWDAAAGRPDIRYHDGTFYGGLHCGDTLEAFTRTGWQSTRIELRGGIDNWYLSGIENDEEILWLKVRN